jgi:hypothetical protein
MIHLTKKKVRQASASDFDQDPWMLNTENGTVDLRTGTLRPHRPQDLLSKMIPLSYQHAECPQFMAFLSQIMGCRSPLTCPISISRRDTFITMVEAAELGDFCDRAVVDNLTLYRALLFECKVRARSVVVAKVRGQRPL